MKMSDVRDEQLARKLALYLGSHQPWISDYADWCAGNDVDPAQIYEDRNVQLFVKHQRGQK